MCSVATVLIVVVLLTLLPFQSSVVCHAWSLRRSYQWSIPSRLLDTAPNVEQLSEVKLCDEQSVVTM